MLSGFFIFSIILVFTLSAYFITNVWTKWSASPIIITLSARSTPLDEIPFPAVTICNMNQAQRSSVHHIPTDSVKYSFLQNLCLHSVNVTDDKNLFGKWPQFRQFILDVSTIPYLIFIAVRILTYQYFMREGLTTL